MYGSAMQTLHVLSVELAGYDGSQGNKELCYYCKINDQQRIVNKINVQ